MITVLFLSLVLVIPAAIYEGSIALYNKIQDAREWRKIKKIYY